MPTATKPKPWPTEARDEIQRLKDENQKLLNVIAVLRSMVGDCKVNEAFYLLADRDIPDKQVNWIGTAGDELTALLKARGLSA